jgi:hypothetical protein
MSASQGNEVAECWQNRLEILGEQEDVTAFLEALKLPADVLARHGATGHPMLFGMRSFSAHVPPPEPTDSALVVEALDRRHHEVGRVWAKTNWGCESDFVEDGSARFIPEGAALTFFTYGGIPDVWCERAADVSWRQGHHVLLVLTAYKAVGVAPEEARVLEVSGAAGVLQNDRVTGMEQVAAFLAGKGLSWDGLTMGPFTINPPISYIPRKG